MDQSSICNFDIFQTISQFLSTKELLTLQQVSSTFKRNVNLALKLLLLKKGFLCQDDIPYNILYRTIMARETLFWSFDEQVKPFKRKHTVDIPSKQIKMGLKFSAILTHTSQLLICTTQTYIDTTMGRPKFQIRENVKSFSVLGKNRLMYLTHNGDLYVIFEDEQERLLYQHVNTFEQSFYLCIVLFEQPTQLEQFQDTFVTGVQVYLSESTIDNILDANRVKRIVGFPENEQIISLAVGCLGFYALTKSQNVFQSDQAPFKIEQIYVESPVKVTQVPYFNNKQIISLHAGHQYFVALEREEVKAIHDWNNAELLKWLDKNGFEDYVKIVQYNDYNGAEFATQAIDKQFMVDALGLTREDLQIKLSTEISRASTSSFKNYQLYGWGKNDFGQLAIGLSNNVQFQKINLPQLEGFDEIRQIECGWKNMAILTSRGRIFMTLNQVAIQKKEEQQRQEEEEPKQGRKKSRQYDQREQKESKESKELKEKLQQQQELPKFWQDITNIFIKSNDKREYKHYYINLNKEWIVTNYVCLERKIHAEYFQQRNALTKDQIKKFKQADKVIDRILWDPSLNKEEYIVGYEDRFLGIMEIPVTDYIKSDIKCHRIQYFKKQNTVVWDRQSRVDLL